MPAQAPRYALYFAPAPDSAWDRFGKHWLGRCLFGGHRVAMPHMPGVCAERQAVLTARPRRYGFHATLKAPFRLAEEHSLEALLDALEDLCREFAPFALPRLRPLHDPRGYLSLAPEREDPRVDDIAANCVTRFDAFRARLDDQELARRRAETLTRRQYAYLERWGYPYVLEDFRFHFSLTDRLERSEAGLIARLKDEINARIPEVPLTFDAISVCEESAPGADLRLLRRVPLAARVRRTYVPGVARQHARVAWAT